MNKAIYAALVLAYAAIHLWALQDHRVDVEARQAPPIAPVLDVGQKAKRVTTTRTINEPINGEWGTWG